jgi:uncharacterized protein (TIGR02246 family)
MYRSYSYGGGVNSAQPTDVATKIRELTQDFCTAFNTGNHDHAAALFQTEGLFMAPGTDPVQGRKAIEAKLREFADLGYQNLRLETTRVDCSGDVAIEVGRYTVSIGRSGADCIEDRGKYLTVWRRLGAWLIAGDCWSSNIPKMVPGVTEIPLSDKNKSNPVIGHDVPKSA